MNLGNFRVNRYGFSGGGDDRGRNSSGSGGFGVGLEFGDRSFQAPTTGMGRGFISSKDLPADDDYYYGGGGGVGGLSSISRPLQSRPPLSSAAMYGASSNANIGIGRGMGLGLGLSQSPRAIPLDRSSDRDMDRFANTDNSPMNMSSNTGGFSSGLGRLSGSNKAGGGGVARSFLYDKRADQYEESPSSIRQSMGMGGRSSSGGMDRVNPNSYNDDNMDAYSNSSQSFGEDVQPRHYQSPSYFSNQQESFQEPSSQSSRLTQSINTGNGNQYGNKPSFFERRSPSNNFSKMDSNNEKPVFRRGGSGGGFNGRGRGQRSNSSRNSNRSSSFGRGGGQQQQSSFRRPEPLLSSPPSAQSTEDKSSKIGVHLDISPAIFQEMTNQGLGDKVFIMIPKNAKTVFDVKMHVATILGVQQHIIHFFINGFRMPEDEDVEAFACISSNSLVQVVMPGFKPLCDMSKFRKNTSNSPSEVMLNPNRKRKKSNQGKPLVQQEQLVEPVMLKRKQAENSMEPSLLEPSSRRARYSTTPSQQEYSARTPRPSLSPSKAQVIEIVLSDDDDEEEKNQKSVEIEEQSTADKARSSSSSGNLVILEAVTGTCPAVDEDSAGTNTNTEKLSNEGQFIVEEEIEGGENSGKDDVERSKTQEKEANSSTSEGLAVTKKKKKPSGTNIQESFRLLANKILVNTNTVSDEDPESCKTTSQEDSGNSDNWLNADGQVVGRGGRRNDGNFDVVDLSSPDSENSGSSVSTNFDDNSNEAFFSITAVQSIPVGVFESNVNDSRDYPPGGHNAQQLQKSGSPNLKLVQKMDKLAGLDSTSESVPVLSSSRNKVQILSPVTTIKGSSSSALFNPFAKNAASPCMNNRTSPVIVDISADSDIVESTDGAAQLWCEVTPAESEQSESQKENNEQGSKEDSVTITNVSELKSVNNIEGSAEMTAKNVPETTNTDDNVTVDTMNKEALAQSSSTLTEDKELEPESSMMELEIEGSKLSNEVNGSITVVDSLLKPINDVNQIKCGSLLLFQRMERLGENGEEVLEDENETTEAEKSESVEGGTRHLSDVKCCKVIGRCGQKLTLEPISGEDDSSTLPTIPESTSSTETDSLMKRKYIFVNFADMINLQELSRQ